MLGKVKKFRVTLPRQKLLAKNLEGGRTPPSPYRVKASIKDRLRLVALYKSLTMIVMSFLCSKCNRTYVFME